MNQTLNHPFLYHPEHGRLEANVGLKKYIWLRVGGSADYLYRPSDGAELQMFLQGLPDSYPITILGGASNCIVRDDGIEGVVIRIGSGLGLGMSKLEQIDQDTISVGAGVLGIQFAKFAAANGFGGFEFLSGIPGTMGGALYMNAGAYGSEFSNVFMSVQGFNYKGEYQRFNSDQVQFSYRYSGLPKDFIITTIQVKIPYLEKSELIEKKIQEISVKREKTQPIRTRTAGSTFKNPSGDKKAWQLIDDSGCRGLRVGGAQMSPLHCNFMLNLGTATATDCENLGEMVRHRVLKHSGVELEWELIRMGRPMIVKADKENIK